MWLSVKRKVKVIRLRISSAVDSIHTAIYLCLWPPQETRALSHTENRHGVSDDFTLPRIPPLPGRSNGTLFLRRRLQLLYNQGGRYLPIRQKYPLHKPHTTKIQFICHELPGKPGFIEDLFIVHIHREEENPND